MQPSGLFQRYRELQRYVNWTDEDAQRVRKLAPAAEMHFAALIDDFYLAIQQTPATMKVITGGREQIERLKISLRTWLKDLFSGNYDQAYVERRWKVGLRHVEIGLDQVYTNAALSRLRGGLLLCLERENVAGNLSGEPAEITAARSALNKLLDLDLAIIEDAYQAEFLARQHRTEQVLQNERLAAIGETMTGLVHESRNALQRTRACLEMLAVEIADRPQRHRFGRANSNRAERPPPTVRRGARIRGPDPIATQEVQLGRHLAASMARPFRFARGKAAGPGSNHQRRQPALHRRPLRTASSLPQYPRKRDSRSSQNQSGRNRLRPGKH